MKKMTPVILASLIGCILSFIIYKAIEKNTFIASKYNVVAIQLGVFNDPTKANEMASSIGGKTFRDGDIYRVYYAILNNSDNIAFIEEYLNKQGISYYLKSLSVSDEVLKESIAFENVMQRLDDTSKLDINEQILKIYEGVMT